MSSRRLMGALVIAAALGTSAAQASAVSFADALPLVPTNSNRNLELQQFDPSLGTLESIEIAMTGRVEGTVRFESMDTSPRLVSMDLSARLDLFAPDMTPLGFTVPLVHLVRNASSYDGTFDFGGTSGDTVGGLSEMTSLPTISLPVNVYGAMFTGLNQVSLPVIATGQSKGTGGGNVIFHFSTLTSAEATITYTYTPIPEPSVLALLLVAMAGRRRR